MDAVTKAPGPNYTHPQCPINKGSLTILNRKSITALLTSEHVRARYCVSSCYHFLAFDSVHFRFKKMKAIMMLSPLCLPL